MAAEDLDQFWWSRHRAGIADTAVLELSVLVAWPESVKAAPAYGVERYTFRGSASVDLGVGCLQRDEAESDSGNSSPCVRNVQDGRCLAETLFRQLFDESGLSEWVSG